MAEPVDGRSAETPPTGRKPGGSGSAPAGAFRPTVQPGKELPRPGDTALVGPPPPRPRAGVPGAPTERLAGPPAARERTQPQGQPGPQAAPPGTGSGSGRVRVVDVPAANAGGERGIAGSETEREEAERIRAPSGIAGDAAAAALEIRPPALEFEALVRARADSAAKLAAAPNLSGARPPRPDVFAAALDIGLKKIREAEAKARPGEAG